MTAGRGARLVRLAACGLVLLLAGWGASQAVAEEVPVPTVPPPTTVAPDPPPPPPVSQPRPDPAPRQRASPRPAPAPRPARQQRVVSPRPTRVAPRPAARATPVAPVPKPKAKPKPKTKPEPVATVAQLEPPPPPLVRPVVTVERVRSNDGWSASKELFAAGIAFLAGLLIPLGLVTAVVLARRRRPRATPEEPVSRQVLTPAPGSTSTQTPATPHPDLARPESVMLGPPPAFVEPPPPLAEREQPPPIEREEAMPVTEPEEAAAAERSEPESVLLGPPPAFVEAEEPPTLAGRDQPPPIEGEEPMPVTEPEEAAVAERSEWEYCEIDWWRGYVKSNFIAKATTPGDAEYVVRESPMFRWRGNGIPEATPASIAAHEQLLEKLRAEGWEADQGTSSTWYTQTLRRRRAPDALSR
jgi:hypothetical protein